MRRLLIAAVALLLGCQQAPIPGPAQAPVGSLTLQLKAEGDQLAARGDYEAAVVKYQAAVSQEPADGAIWFALGTALSHLGQREGTIEAFRRVLDLGRPESEEVQLARRWLVSAGVLSESVAFLSGSESRATAGPSAATQPPSGPMGGLRGKTDWTGVVPANEIMVKIILAGDDPETRARTFTRSIRLGQPFAFENIPAGSYRLTADAGSKQLWEQQVQVEPNKQTVLNLTPATSPVSPGDWPGAVEKDHDGGFGPNYDRTEHTRPPAHVPPPAGQSR